MDRYDEFLDMHVPGEPLLLANAWDAGTAKVLAHCGFRAVATTSGGHAASLGRRDGGVSRDEALAHARELAAAAPCPVSADLENCFADEPDAAAETVRLAAATGLAGASIEDYDPKKATIYDRDLAVARVAAAAEAAHEGPHRVVLTARADNHFRGIDDLGDTIERLVAYQQAGADVVYAPVVVAADDIRRIVDAVDVPVNVLAIPGVPTVAELAHLGVARISVGTGFSLTAMAALVGAARELLDEGTYGFWAQAAGARTVNDAFDA